MTVASLISAGTTPAIGCGTLGAAIVGMPANSSRFQLPGFTFPVKSVAKARTASEGITTESKLCLLPMRLGIQAWLGIDQRGQMVLQAAPLALDFLRGPDAQSPQN